MVSSVTNTKKGQMSLEMIIGLVILLVLATVVVSLFMNVFGGGVTTGESIRSEQQIRQECSSLCSSYKEAQTTAQTLSAAVAYCTETFTFDANENGITTDVAGSGYNSYCEDGVFCHNMHSCQRAGEALDAEKCNELMNTYYENVQNSGTPKADTNTSVQNNVGSCDLTSIDGPSGTIDTWYTQYFSG